jgi:hypothetical protein
MTALAVDQFERAVSIDRLVYTIHGLAALQCRYLPHDVAS